MPLLAMPVEQISNSNVMLKIRPPD